MYADIVSPQIDINDVARLSFNLVISHSDIYLKIILLSPDYTLQENGEDRKSVV